MPAYEITGGDWSSDVCSSDLETQEEAERLASVELLAGALQTAEA